MTHGKRWLGVLNRQSIDRVPTDNWGTLEITSRLLNVVAMYNTIYAIGKR